MDGLVGEASRALATLASRPAYGLSDQELTASLVDVFALASQATAIVAKLTREAQGRELPRRVRAASATTWLRQLLRVTATDARRLLGLGEVLNARPVLADAIEAGTLNVGQAAAIGDVLEDVPADDPAVVDKVESVLLDYADRYEPTVLRRLGEQALAHVNPELADARLRDELERQERRARKRRGLTLSSDGLVEFGCADFSMSKVQRSSLPRWTRSLGLSTPPTAPIRARPRRAGQTRWPRSAGSLCALASCPTTVARRHS